MLTAVSAQTTCCCPASSTSSSSRRVERQLLRAPGLEQHGTCAGDAFQLL